MAKCLSSYPLKRVSQLLSTTEPLDKVLVQGWVKTEHRKGRWSFIHINDGSTSRTLQAIVPKEVGRNFGIGSSVQIAGKWAASKGALQAMEIQTEMCRLWAKDEGQPIHGTADNVRNELHLRAKHQGMSAILRLRSQLVLLTHQYFVEKGFVHIDTPLISANDCEGAGEAFVVSRPDDPDFFGDGYKYLPVSGQLHLEAMTSALPQVYTLNAAFRAEKSLSRQHMAEFRMLEVEKAFTNSIDQLCDEIEEYIRFLSNQIVSRADDLGVLTDFLAENSAMRLLDILSNAKEFPRLHYNEAVSILSKNGHVVKDGLNKAQELFLVDYFKAPLFVYNFPSSQKPFYMKRTDDDQEALCFDLLAPFVGELAGGSVRENDIAKLKSRQKPEALEWYFNLRQRGSSQSGGYGIGFERLMQSLFGIANIKDTIPFPRWYKHCQC